MTERRVSVRLAAVGGQAVKNELREIGRDGAQAFQQLERASGGGRAAVQNFAFQVQDFAVQVAGGTAASRALAQQLPQLLGGFGVMGAVVGAAVAVLVPLGASLFDAADGTAKLIEEMASATGSISAVEGAISALEGTQRAYTEAIAASGGASSAAAALVISNSAAEFEARKSLLSLEIELLRIRGLEQATDQANLQAGIDRARQGVNDRVSNIAYENNRAYYGGVDRAGNTLDAYVNTRAGEAAIAGTTPDMIALYQQDLAEFEEATKLDRMALQKVTAERTLSELALERAEGLLDTKFEDLTTGGSIDAPAAPSGGGRRGGGAGHAAADGMDQAAVATERARTALESYAETAMKSGENIQGALAGAFTSAEKALGDFVRTGKVDFRGFVTSIIADLAMVGARRFILGPLANALGGALGGLGSGGGFLGTLLSGGEYHTGGLVGAGGASRMIPALALAGAPRFHSGGGFGLRSDEQAAILQRGERVLSRAQNRAWEGGAGAQINIYARDAQSFRQSRTQVAADIARAVSAGRRGM